MIGIDGAIVTGMSVVIVNAMDTGQRLVPAGRRRAGARLVHLDVGRGPLHRRAAGVIGEMLALAGAVLTLLAAVGVVRFPDALTRMHALTKASTLGLTLVAVGAAFVLPTANDVTSALAGRGALRRSRCRSPAR